jgi:halocyanin-like protein
MSEERDARLGRRRLLRAGAGAVGAGLVSAGTTGTATAQSGPFGGWLSDVGNYDGVHDRTGSGDVTVEVGVEANQGAFGFGPAAVQVDPGTTVVWEWTGEGGLHNVAAESGGDFSSENVQEAGFTYEQTFEEEGVVQYFCLPHRALGMKGVVVVGDAVPEGAEVVDSGGGSGGGGGSGDGSGGGGGSGDGSGGGGGGGSGDGSGGGGGGGSGDGSGGSGGGGDGSGGGLGQGGFTMSLVVGGSLVAAFLSPIVFGLVLMLRDKTGGPSAESDVEHGAEHADASHED